MDKICTICLRAGHLAHACTEELWRLPVIEEPTPQPEPARSCLQCKHSHVSVLAHPCQPCLAAGSAKHPLWEPKP